MESTQTQPPTPDTAELEEIDIPEVTKSRIPAILGGIFLLVIFSGAGYFALISQKTCIPDTSCALSTCNQQACTAVRKNCSTYSITGMNTDACPVDGPDLVANNDSLSSSPAGTVVFTGMLRNRGVGATGSFISYFEIQGASSVLWTEATVLGPGATTTLRATRSLTAGKYLVRFCADGAGTVPEAHEDNNCSSPWSVLTILPSKGPSVSCTPTFPSSASGDTVTWSVVPNNFASVPTYAWSDSNGVPAQGAGTVFKTVYSRSGAFAPHIMARSATESASASCSPVTILGPADSCDSIPVSVIGASQIRIMRGASTRIEYSATGVPPGTSCTISGTNIGGVGINSIFTRPADTLCNVVSGVRTVNSLNAQDKYTITCLSSINSVIVNVLN